MRRLSTHEVRPLSDLFTFLGRGELLDGRTDATVFDEYWPLSRSDSFGLSGSPSHPIRPQAEASGRLIVGRC